MAKFSDVAPSSEFFNPAKDSTTSIMFITDEPKYALAVWTQIGDKRIPLNSFAINRDTGEINQKMDCPILDLVPSLDPKDRPKVQHVYGIFNLDLGAVQVWKISQKPIIDAINKYRELAKKRGRNFIDFLYSVARDDSGAFTKYVLDRDVDSELTDEQKDMIAEARSEDNEKNIFNRILQTTQLPDAEYMTKIGLGHIQLPAVAKSSKPQPAKKAATAPVQKTTAALRSAAPPEPPVDENEYADF